MPDETQPANQLLSNALQALNEAVKAEGRGRNFAFIYASGASNFIVSDPTDIDTFMRYVGSLANL